jgi:hypothetical protein
MNRRKLTEAEDKMMQVEKLRRRIQHAPPELVERMTEELDRLHLEASRMVREAAEAEEDGE